MEMNKKKGLSVTGSNWEMSTTEVTDIPLNDIVILP